jgi:hypothetical protein
MANRVNIDMTATERGLFDKIAKLEASNEKLVSQYKRLAGESRKAGKSGKEDVDGIGKSIDTAVAKTATWALGLKAANAVISEISSGLDGIIAKRMEAMGKLQGREFGFAQLAQLAGGDKTKYEELKAQASALFKGGGAATASQAGDIIFAAESTGMNTPENRKLLQEQYSAFRGNTEQMIRDAASIRYAFGEAQTGDLRAIVSQALAASQVANARVDEVMNTAAANAQGAQLLQWTPQQQFSSIAALSKVMPIEKAGTTLSAFAMGLTKEESMAEKPLPEQLGVIGDQSIEQLREWIGADLAAQIEADLPNMILKDGKKRTKPFKDMTLKEALKKASGMTEAETAEAFGPYAAQIKAALDKKMNFVGMSPIEALTTIQSWHQTPEQLAKKFPKKGIAAYGALIAPEVFPLLQESIDRQAAARSGDLAGATSKLTADDPGVALSKGLRASTATTEMSRDYMGKVTALSEAVKEDYDRALKDAGVPWQWRALHKAVRWSVEKFAPLGGEETAGAEKMITDFGQPSARAQMWGLQREKETGKYPADLIPQIAEDLRAYDKTTGMDGWERFAARMEAVANKMDTAGDKQLEAAKKEPSINTWFGGPRGPVQARPATASGVDRR